MSRRDWNEASAGYTLRLECGYWFRRPRRVGREIRVLGGLGGHLTERGEKINERAVIVRPSPADCF